MNTPAPRYSPARQFLRDATHPAHIRLNRHPLLAGITKPDYPLASYHRVLQTYFGFYASVEDAITRYLAETPVFVNSDGDRFDYASRMKTPWLRQDLLQANIDPETITVRPGEFKITTPLQLVGVLYTIEGSSLGGEVISERISRNLGLTSAAGGRFFYGYGEHILALWHEFESFMDFSLSSPDQMNVAAFAAVQTFCDMEQMLDRA